MGKGKGEEEVEGSQGCIVGLHNNVQFAAGAKVCQWTIGEFTVNTIRLKVMVLSPMCVS